jgi:hypothetical protein
MSSLESKKIGVLIKLFFDLTGWNVLTLLVLTLSIGDNERGVVFLALLFWSSFSLTYLLKIEKVL